jgi:4-diphosphocytidyl-2C-methyl-D-erythritol kinase
VNDLHDAARALCPAIDDALFPGAMVSGSGPTVFATYDSPERARAVAATLPGAVAVEPVPAGYGEVRSA